MSSRKLALITGATKGIGKAISYQLARDGIDLFISSRMIDELDVLARDLAAIYDVKVFPVEADLLDENAPKKIMSQVLKENRGLDILVNNAGILKANLIGMASKEDINTQFMVNVFSVIRLTQLASRMMIKKGGGSIINISSIMGLRGESGLSVYSSTKAAIIGLTKSLSKELAVNNIRVNAIAPGFIATEMANSVTAEQYSERIKSISLNRIGCPEDVARFVSFLVSDSSSYVTGQIIGVDGGMIL